MNTQHIRPLWIGFALCVLTPVLIVGVTVFHFPPRVIVPFEQVVIVSLLGSLIASLGIVLPYVLWLRGRKRLNAFRVCIAGAVAGGVVLGAFKFQGAYWPNVILSSAIQATIKSAIGGAIIGLFAALLLCCGSGISFNNTEAKQ